jgi:hypothetical protein
MSKARAVFINNHPVIIMLDRPLAVDLAPLIFDVITLQTSTSPFIAKKVFDKSDIHRRLLRSLHG